MSPGPEKPEISPKLDSSTELASHRTGMSLHRTRMSADRTLMSIIRTSLSLIGFGFTIFQFFVHLRSSNIMDGASQAPRRFGLALVFLGIVMLAIGIVYHLQFMIGLRSERRYLADRGLIPTTVRFPLSLQATIAFLLLLVGLLAIVSMALKVGPFN